jgi:ATP-dependent DNA helicase RecG
LGLAVTDEQHRFGVAQRYSLWQKNKQPPHVLVMTATPIPRTLAMTVYGDLEISKIDELPSGRKPIRTVHRYERGMNELYAFMRAQIATGRQIYIVYPLIEESEKLDLQNLGEGFELAKHHFPEPQYNIGMLHGRMKSAEKEAVMKGFVSGETQVLVSTTVIEVGVNVPNASVMAIMNAERFGLAQLHQLRGRVGRGAAQSYCILVTSEKLSSDGRKRIQTMVESTDGFRIAEVDMELRGPGDLEGTRQSGLLDLKLVNIATDTDIIETARNTAAEILTQDPELLAPAHQGIAHFYKAYKSKQNDWSRVS